MRAWHYLVRASIGNGRVKGLFGQVATYTAAQMVTRGAQVAALLIFPLLLSPSEYGALGLIVAAAALVNVVAPLEVTQGLVRYLPTASPGDKPALSASAWWFTLVAVLVTAIAGLLAAPVLSAALFGASGYEPVFRTAVMFFAGNALFYFLLNQCRWEFRVADYVVMSIAFAGLTLGLGLALAVQWRDALLGAITGQAIGALAVVAYGMVKLRSALWHRPNAVRTRQMLRFSLPLVPASLAVFAAIYASRLIVNDKLTLADVGLFTFASQVATIPSFVILGLQAAVTPFVMARFAEARTPPLLARLFEGVVCIGLLAALGIAFFIGDILRTIGNHSYAGAAPLVMILAPAYLIQQLPIFFPGFAIAERTGLQMVVAITSAVIVVAANYALIDALGLAGAALATLLSALAFLSSWVVLANRFYPIPVRWPRVAALAAAGAAAAWAESGLQVSKEWLTGWGALAVKPALLLAVAGAALALDLVAIRTLADQVRRLRHGSMADAQLNPRKMTGRGAGTWT